MSKLALFHKVHLITKSTRPLRLLPTGLLYLASADGTFGARIGSNCPEISGTVPDFLPLSRVPEGRIDCPGCKLDSCSMSSFYTTGDQKPRVELLATVSLFACCSQLLGIQSVTTKNLIAGREKKAWSLVFNPFA